MSFNTHSVYTAVLSRGICALQAALHHLDFFLLVLSPCAQIPLEPTLRDSLVWGIFGLGSVHHLPLPCVSFGQQVCQEMGIAFGGDKAE